MIKKNLKLFIIVTLENLTQRKNIAHDFEK